VLKGITGLGGIVYANYVEYLFRPSLTGLAKALLAHRADPNLRIEKPPRLGGVNASNAVGATPFLLAAASPDAEIMRLLADAGADPKIATENGLTPLMVAAGVDRGQDFTEDERRLSYDAVRLAVDLGGDVNAANADGLTALHGAASNGMDNVVQYLAGKGARLDVRDKYQQTPLSIATGIRLPWIPKGDELGEIIRPSTRDLLVKLGATPVDSPGYFKPPSGDSEAFKFNQSQRYGGDADPEAK
jgi:ankyrin repeat protein